MTVPRLLAGRCQEMPQSRAYVRPGEEGHFHYVGCCGNTKKCRGKVEPRD